MSAKRLLLAFAACVAVTSAVILPVALSRHHHFSRKVGVQIGSTALLDLGLAVVLWLLVVAVMALVSRGGSPHDGPGAGAEKVGVAREAGGSASRTHAEASFGEPR